MFRFHIFSFYLPFQVESRIKIGANKTSFIDKLKNASEKREKEWKKNIVGITIAIVEWKY